MIPDDPLAEIDRLRKENELLLKSLEMVSGQAHHLFQSAYEASKASGKARAEVERLRAMMGAVESPSTEDEYLESIDNAFKEAEQWLSMVDCPSEEEDPDGWNSAYEERFHCETCTMRGIGNILWPVIQQYIDWCKVHPAVPQTVLDV